MGTADGADVGTSASIVLLSGWCWPGWVGVAVVFWRVCWSALIVSAWMVARRGEPVMLVVVA